MHIVPWKKNPFSLGIVVATVITASLVAGLGAACEAQASDKETELKRSSHIRYIQSENEDNIE